MTTTAAPRPTSTAVLDRIEAITLSSVILPLANPISDAKVFTGRQRPMTEVAFLFAEVTTATGACTCPTGRAWVSR